LTPDTQGQAFLDEVRWARLAMRCGPLDDLLRASSAPLGPRRFFTNMLHSFSNARLRVPPDPERAFREFCEPDERENAGVAVHATSGMSPLGIVAAAGARGDGAPRGGVVLAAPSHSCRPTTERGVAASARSPPDVCRYT